MESDKKKIKTEAKEKIEKILANRKKGIQSREFPKGYVGGNNENEYIPESKENEDISPYNNPEIRSVGAKKTEDAREKYNRIKRSAKKNAETLKNAPENIRKNIDKARKIPENIRTKAEKIKRMREKFRKESLQDFKKNLKKNIKNRVAAKRAILKKKLKRRLRAKVSKIGKNPYLSCLFMIMMLLAFANDFVDIFVALSIQIIGLVISITGIGAVFGAPIIAFVELVGEVIDVVTGVILTVFALIIGGVTGKGIKKIATKLGKTLCKYGITLIIELIPVISLFPTWVVVVAWNWYKIRKEADEAEQLEI